ncbi:MAG TPA: cytochrome c oxidase assembly protein [Methylocystis sp.]|nr:cytochrome c oxidase assembly protein [Methylocystis sp.]
MTQAPENQDKRRQRLIAAAAVGGSLVMLALSFASVPLYRAFCAATGFGGATQVAKNGPAIMGQRVLSVRFDGNVTHELPWRFEPEIAKISLRTGQTATVYYRVTNLSDRETAGIAAYNVAPDQAGVWFNKLACFCFSEQRLKPHETAEWPVVFFLDPALENEESMQKVEEITLSYSFFPVKGGGRSGEPPAREPKS